ncbi:carboxypeptidase-like regulatory domain-containing protein [Constantimarinum furrinae]|uniref:Uncharacterized protein n=1 Tax=Constantimarinum furrinae TaxID=2562285 RepID=A0A7G8PRA3_9FLAO|nr:carboxypeptidase-like regulatory domain-containing protein [Constantimarinum furrinae]QNJ96869.1 hypothetical protein ALE3EI_0281 [Constantimarinum furrinae]
MSCLLLPLFMQAQTQVLQGKVTNEIEVEGIHILNTSSRYNSITDAYGNFAITVKVNDTLVFSSVNYMPESLPVTPEIFEKGVMLVKLSEMVNELDEVVLGPNLSGNLLTDIKNIKTEDEFNFDDVGIPGFKGEPEEKIVPIVPYLGLATAVDLEALYKHLSGYYKKLRIQRKWDAQNSAVAHIISYYGPDFFSEAFKIPENRLYDFLLYCIETSSIQTDFNTQHYAGVLSVLEEKSVIYVERLSKKEE